MLPPLERIAPIQETGTTTKTESFARVEGGFADAFQSAIDNVREADGNLSQAVYKLTTGQLDNPAELTIAATKNEVAVSLLIQLRNKAMDSYNEIMRINF